MIEYAQEPTLAAEEFVAVLNSSGLASRRPVAEPDRIATMLEHANIIVTARDEGKLVGVSRGLSDFAFCFYLSDLAVDQAYQGQGVGRKLIEESHRIAGLDTTLILLAAPAAATYYPYIGLQHHESCWIIPRRG